jgi:hypothetical protein
MERSDDYFIVLALLTVLVYAAGIAYSLKFKQLFFLSIIWISAQSGPLHTKRNLDENMPNMMKDVRF